MLNMNTLNMMKLDWLGMRKYRSRIIISVITACFMAVLMDSVVLLPFLLMGMFDSASYCFDAEERGKLNHLYLTLPISRETLITARYAMSLILHFIGIAAGIILTIGFSAIMHGRTFILEYTFQPSAETMILLVCFSMLYCAFLSLTIHPTLFKKGYAKAKVIGYALPMYGSMTVMFIFVNVAIRVEVVGGFVNSAYLWVLRNIALTSVFIFGMAVLLLVASYKLSQRVYAKREF